MSKTLHYPFNADFYKNEVRMPFCIVHGDITKVQADAVVNAANVHLLAGGGVCGAIFKAAGFDRLSDACRKIGHCDEGNAVITPAFDLPANFIIHTPGPVWRGGNYGEEEILRSCYWKSMELACSHGCKSIAFPLISSGIFGYPAAKALAVAQSAISDYLIDHDLKVTLVLFK